MANTLPYRIDKCKICGNKEMGRVINLIVGDFIGVHVCQKCETKINKFVESLQQQEGESE